MRQKLIDLLKAVERAVPPPKLCHHVITYAQYGSSDMGWSDKLALQVNWKGFFYCWFLEEEDFDMVPEEFAAKILSDLTDESFPAQVSDTAGRYL